MAKLTRRFLVCSAASLGLAKASWASSVSMKTPTPQITPASIGVALPRTGVYALQGDEVFRGIQLAVDAVNARAGVAGQKIQLISEDMPSQASAATVVNELVMADNANILFGSGSSALSYPATAAAELAQTPFIELTAPADGIMSRGFKYLLRIGPTTGMIGQLAAATVTSRYPQRRLGLLFNTGATAGAIAAAAINDLKVAKQPVTLSIAYPEDADSLVVQVGRLMRAGVEVLFHAAGVDDSLALFEAMQNLSWRPTTLIGCGEGYELRDTQKALGAALDGTLVIGAPFYPGRAEDLKLAYEAKYGVPPRSADSCTAYVGAKLVFDTLGAVQGDASKLLGALRQLVLPKEALINGFGVDFDDNGQNRASFVTLQNWRAGELTPL